MARARAKLRSVHNNYLTLPVVFTMLSNHFPFTYGHSYAWLILVVLLVLSVVVVALLPFAEKLYNQLAAPLIRKCW